MKGNVLLGILILVVGLIGAIYGITGMSEPDNVREDATITGTQQQTVGDQNAGELEEVASVLIPVIAGVSIAAGAALIGIGMGAFRRPKIVPPDSPEASKAATTRGTTP
jgi:hypothetical protein